MMKSVGLDVERLKADTFKGRSAATANRLLTLVSAIFRELLPPPLREPEVRGTRPRKLQVRW